MSGKRDTCYFKSTLAVVVVVALLTVAIVALNIYLVVLTPEPSKNDPSEKSLVSCKVLIIGSGFAGSFAAFQLAPLYGDTLCLVERLARDGGRIYDVSEYPGGPVFGAGALRLLRMQSTMLALADELGIELQEVENDEEAMKVRGKTFYRGATTEANRMCVELFPTLNCTSEGRMIIGPNINNFEAFIT